MIILVNAWSTSYFIIKKYIFWAKKQKKLVILKKIVSEKLSS